MLQNIRAQAESLAGQGQQLLASTHSHAKEYGQTLRAKGGDSAAWLQQFSKDSGVADYASWAAQKSVQAGSAASNAAHEAMKHKIASEYGEEVFDMLEALNQCTAKIKQELCHEQAKFGLGFAMPLVHLHHDGLPPPKGQREEKSRSFLLEAKHWLKYAAGAYGVDPKLDDVANVSKAITCVTEVLTAKITGLPVLCPGHFVAVDNDKRAVILGVRGTSTIADAITDAVGESVEAVDLPGVQCHKAMLESARQVLQRTIGDIDKALSANSGSSLIVTGHSLGAGTSILCSLLLAANPPRGARKIRCFAYAPPPVVSSISASQVRAVEIHSFVNRHDAVPRACLSNIFRLGQEAMSVDRTDLTLLERLKLVRRGKTESADEASKQKVIGAVQQQRESDPHSKFPPLYVPGTVYWIERPEVEEQGGHKIWRIDTKELQAMNLKGGANALKDHLCTGYQTGIDVALENSEADMCCSSCTVM